MTLGLAGLERMMEDFVTFWLSPFVVRVNNFEQQYSVLLLRNAFHEERWTVENVVWLWCV